jgi:hypothetical protein
LRRVRTGLEALWTGHLDLQLLGLFRLLELLELLPLRILVFLELLPLRVFELLNLLKLLEFLELPPLVDVDLVLEVLQRQPVLQEDAEVTDAQLRDRLVGIGWR